jgi:hypothetical protein
VLPFRLDNLGDIFLTSRKRFDELTMKQLPRDTFVIFFNLMATGAGHNIVTCYRRYLCDKHRYSENAVCHSDTANSDHAT